MNPVSDIGRDRSERGESWTALWDALVDGTEWHDQAACRGADTDKWFPGVGGAAIEARAICQTCPVQSECLDYAVRNRIARGVWGGLGYKRRPKLERPIANELTGRCVDCGGPAHHRARRCRSCYYSSVAGSQTRRCEGGCGRRTRSHDGRAWCFECRGATRG